MLMKRIRKNRRVFFLILFGLFLTACEKQAVGDDKGAKEYIAESKENIMTDDAAGHAGESAEKETKESIAEDTKESAEENKSIAEDTEESAEENTKESTAEVGTEQTEKNISGGRTEKESAVTVYLPEETAYSDEIIPVQYVDDLSLLGEMKYTDSTYVWRDGRIYYRRYHENSFEEAALWGNYNPVSEMEKEIVCIDGNGAETVLFTDKGYGDMYLLNDRFYMTEFKTEKEDGAVYRRKQLYSVDMRGKDRIDYGNGSIFAIDETRNIVVMEIIEAEGAFYYAMNYKTGETKPLLAYKEGEYCHYIGAYRDGWLYYERINWSDAGVFELWAVSAEGERKKIIALASENNQRSNGYKESIWNIKADRERVYFIVGGYDGCAGEFQGGKLISIKPDGTDYKAVETPGDTYYICHDNGKTLLYFPRFFMPVADDVQECDTMVWDIEADICYLTDFPQTFLQSYDWQAEQIYKNDSDSTGVLFEPSFYYDEIDEKEVNIYAIPDDSGRIVRVAMNLGACIAKYEDGEVDRVQYKDLYYADGVLYFRVEYSVYDKDSSIGWRDGYRRLRSDVYRLKTGESMAKLLYSY